MSTSYYKITLFSIYTRNEFSISHSAAVIFTLLFYKNCNSVINLKIRFVGKNYKKVVINI